MTAREFVEKFLEECDWERRMRHDDGNDYLWIRRHCVDREEAMAARTAILRFARELGVIENPVAPFTFAKYDVAGNRTEP